MQILKIKKHLRQKSASIQRSLFRESVLNLNNNDDLLITNVPALPTY